MSNGAHAADNATYRVLRELGQRSQHSFAAMRDGAVVVLNRFTRETIGRSLSPHPAETRLTAEEMALLLRDAHCVAKNWHPNIARVRHVDLTGDTLFVATELLDGITLEELLELGRSRHTHPEEPILSHAVVARIFLDVLAGLQALHGLRDGINAPLSAFHGELCPANIIVGKDGVARIVNVFRPRPVKITVASEALGYASPETLAAEIEQDARVDLWAVGVMLWEALMERRLYDDVHPTRVAQRQREEDIPRTDAPLAEVAMRALAFDPALRFRSAQDVAANIRALSGTIATGSVVAQTVVELAGERIRSRRLELDPVASSRQRPTVAPESTRSETHAVESVTATAEAPSFDTRLAPLPEVPTPAAPAVHAASSEEKGTPAAPHEASALKPPPVPVRGRSQVPPPMTTREMRATSPSEPDVETAYSPRPLPPRQPTGSLRPALPRPSRPPFPARAPGKATPSSLPPPEDDDDLPGPRQSTPDNDYLAQLGAEAMSSNEVIDANDLVNAEDTGRLGAVHDAQALAAAREVVLSTRSVTPTPEPLPLEAIERVRTPPNTPTPFFPAMHHLTAPLGPPPSAGSRSAAPRPRRPEPSTRTPFVIDVLPQAIASSAAGLVHGRGRVLPLAAAIAAVALLVLIVGAAIIARRGAPADATTAAPSDPPPSTVILAPPPVDPLPSASGAPTSSTPRPPVKQKSLYDSSGD